METFFERISNYQFINNLLPGTVFVYFLNHFTGFTIQNDNIFVSLFIYYFAGIIISRFGSIVIEPILKKTKFITYQPYNNYIFASLRDKKINLLMEHNNLFRSLLAMLLLMGLSIIFDKLQILSSFFKQNDKIIVLLLLIILFLFSFRKQTKFISDRIEYYTDESKKENGK
jgi:hypothetical protein